MVDRIAEVAKVAFQAFQNIFEIFHFFENRDRLEGILPLEMQLPSERYPYA